ncbi:type I restriction enzyme S subunit [Planomicrobium stackebrandtii]|uniref:Type I restriction enzyme S subunit n=1 Tax=Planomicrobium stackebrandtii TaxID=253160 RepID=A0ABU0GUR0_9BACL|nr:restriction endonuclease subunit S [Planomicrobium stackebrandtii]MDQ0428526.1 type I restriction enzyme S subunit [Planomicrobium stackebrandtii]
MNHHEFFSKSDSTQYQINKILIRVNNPVNVDENQLYNQIGIRSHAKGIFFKDPVSGKELGNKRVFWIEPDCFIVNIVFAWERAIARTSEQHKGYIASHRFPMYKANEEIVDLDYITFLFKTKKGQYLLELASPGGAGRNKTLGQNEFGKLEVTLPSLNSQKKIVKLLLLHDRKRQKQKEKVEELQQFKKGMMQKIFSQELRFKDEDGGEFGEWEEKKIGHVLKIKHGRDQKKIETPSGKFPILATGGIIGRTDTFIYDQESVLIGRKGTIDRPVFMDTPFWTVDTLFYSEIREDNSPKFIFYVFQDINWKLYNEASGVPSLSAKTIEAINITVPQHEEQKKIASYLSVIDRKIEKEKEKLMVLEEQKKGFMQGLFI